MSQNESRAECRATCQTLFVVIGGQISFLASLQIFKRVCPRGTNFLRRYIALEYAHEEPHVS